MQAAILNLYSDAADLGAISEVKSDGSTYIVANDTSNTLGGGDALRLADYTDSDKPEAWWDVATATTGFRIDLRAGNLNKVDADQDINLRFGNSADGRPTSSSRTFMTLSFEQSGSLKVDGSTQANFDSGPLDISLIVNTQAVSLSYTLFGMDRVLAPLSSDLWVDGALEDENNDLNLGGNITAANGMNELGFTGSSDSAINMDYIFDDITLYTGDDISVPEPSSAALMLLGGMLAMRRRRD